MKKLTIISLLCLCMIFASCGKKTSIGEINLSDLTYTGSGLSVNENTVNIKKGGVFTICGELKDGMIYVDTKNSVELILDGASISNTKGPAILIENAENVTLTLSEGKTNTLSDGEENVSENINGALFSNSNITINGMGSLDITANFEHGISSEGNILISGGNISINSKEHGINTSALLQIDSGYIKVISAEGKGLKAKQELTINGGEIDITTLEDEGIESKGLLTITGGIISIDAGEDGINAGSSDSSTTETTPEAPEFNVENIPKGEMPKFDRGNRPEGEMPGFDIENIPEGEMPKFDRGNRPEGEMPEFDIENIPEGEMPKFDRGNRPEGEIPEFDRENTPPANFGGGFGRIDDETASAHAITISGGKIYIKSAGDGIDSNGNLIINGGEIVIEGPTSNGDGPLDSDGQMKITGGKVTTLSSAGMIQLPDSPDGQKIMRITFDGTLGAGTEIRIAEKESKNILLSMISAIDFQALIFSDEALSDKTEYTIHINGEVYKEATLEEMSSQRFGGNFGAFRGDMGNPGGKRPQMNPAK